MATLRSISLLVIGVAILATAAWAYRGIELLEGKTAFAAHNYSRAAQMLKPFGGWHDPEAEAALGDMYANGLGLREDDDTAFALATKAANTGLAYPETLLGTLYEEGKGTPADDTQAVFWFRQAAAQGDAEAETKLGEAYVQGLGVGQDYGQAANLFQQAADQADPVAQNDLGRLYQIGLGEPHDDNQAAQWFEKSAFLGNLDGQVNLGILYHEGSGVPQDDSKAVKLFSAVAPTGNPLAEYYLGLAYAKGEGVGADTAQAVTWLQRAAIQGDAAAQTALGQVFEEPGTMDAVLAYMLFDLAAGQGNAVATAQKAALGGELTPAQLAEAQADASQWHVNMALPVTSFEDRAPQLVFGLSAPSAVIQASQIWFSRGFTLAGQKWVATFVSRPGKTCHGCGAAISVATFRLDGKGAVVASAGQSHLTDFGVDGAAPLNDPTAAPESPARIAAVVQSLASDRVAVLVPLNAAELGEYSTGYEVLGFALADPADLASGRWSDLGRITTGAEHLAGGVPSGNCTADTQVATLACASWQGVISVVPAADSAWPDIAVKALGTVLDVHKNAEAAPDEIYHFDGKGYALVPAAGLRKA
jgi:TPR repeat protein